MLDNLPNMVEFGSRIASLRATHKMSLDQVAVASGMTKSHVWELEQGRSRNPTVRAVWGIAAALGVTPAYMLGIATDANSIDPLAHKLSQIIRAETAKCAIALEAENER